MYSSNKVNNVITKRFGSITPIFNQIRRKADEAKFQILQPFKLHRLEKGPNTSVILKKTDALKFYRQMVTIRRIENSASNLYKEKKIRGFCHLYSGQEAVAVGMKAAMRPGDSLITAYRAHGWVWLMGAPLEQLFGELCGRVTGCSRGKGGSMHTFVKNFYGGNGIVGAQVPVGTGVGLKFKLTGKDSVSFTLYGDGAANQGQVFESFNMAKLWNLPVIFVCENNKYGMGTPADRASASTDFYTRGDFVPGLQINGMDVLATREATLFAIGHCLANRGPLIMEMITYRYFGHSMSDPGTSYRTRDEVQSVRQSKDPISSFKDKLIESKFASDEEIKQIEAEIRKEVDAATAQAVKALEPGLEELSTDIYMKPLEKTVRGISPWQRFKYLRLGKSL